jgi:MYXO-CTERM domain-containing protein
MVMVNATDMRTTSITSSVAVDGFYYSLVDQEGAFSIIMPCSGVHCEDPVPLSVGMDRDITITCTPPRTGVISGELYIVSDVGGHPGPPIALSCNGVMAPGGPDVNLSTNMVSLMSPVGTPATTNVTLQNAGSAALTVGPVSTAGMDWTMDFGPPCTGSLACTVNPGDMILLDFTFTPSMAGDIDATFTIQTNDPDENPVMIFADGFGTSAGAPEVTPSTLSVTLMAPVGMTAMSTTEFLRNDGMAPLTVGPLSSSNPDWSVELGSPCTGMTTCTLDPSELVSLVISFTPSAVGDSDAMLDITTDDSDENPVTIFADGTGTDTMSDSTLTLITPITEPVQLTTVVGSTITQPIEVSNTPATQAIMASASITSAPPFGVSPSFHNLNPDDPRTFTVSCTPQSTSTVPATLTIASSDVTTANSPLEIAFECTGTANHLSVTPAVIDLGEVRIDGMGPRVVETVELSTDGPTLQVHMIAEQVDHPKVTLGAASAPDVVMGVPTTFAISLDPGDTEGEVMTTVDVSAGPDTETVTFRADIVRAMIAPPADVDFGSVCIGDTVQPQMLRLASTGSATIALGIRPELEKGAASPFSLEWLSPDENGYPVDLLMGQEATVRVAPATQTVAGAYEDHVAWTTDMPMSPRTRVAVRYLDDAGGISPGALEFGAVPLRQTSATQLITVQNCAAAELTLARPIISMPDEFVVVGDPLPPSLAPGATATIAVAFVPGFAGVRMATLSVVTSAGDLEVTLAGTGIDDGTAVGSPASLYACDCSSGDPGSALVILLALAGVVVPRRRRRC